MTLSVSVVSPERVLYTGEAMMVATRTLGGGDIAFQTGHAPFIAALATWPLRVIQSDGKVETIAVHGGFVEVSNNMISVLSDVAELPSQIDVPRAQAAKDAAEAALRNDVNDADAAAALARATVRLQSAAS